MNGLGLAVSRCAGPEPGYDWSQPSVQGGWAWCEGTQKNTRGPAPEQAQSRVGVQSFQPGVCRQALFWLVGFIHFIMHGTPMCAHGRGQGLLAGQAVLSLAFWSQSCSTSPAHPTPPVLQGPVPLSPKGPPISSTRLSNPLQHTPCGSVLCVYNQTVWPGPGRQRLRLSLGSPPELLPQSLLIETARPTFASLGPNRRVP